jgi:hypothetical protein
MSNETQRKNAKNKVQIPIVIEIKIIKPKWQMKPRDESNPNYKIQRPNENQR